MARRSLPVSHLPTPRVRVGDLKRFSSVRACRGWSGLVPDSRVPAGYLYVDGIVGDVGHGVLRDRRVLAAEGVVVVVVTVDVSTGAIVTGPEIITDATRKAMKQALTHIQTGEYAKSFILENRAGAPTLQARRRLMAEHPIEQVGEKLRAMMPWIKANRLVDRSRN